MVWVIFAGVLGVIISVTGGLFLRRLLGEITELRRQITGIDREMRAQRARMKFLRYLLDKDVDDRDTGGRLPDEAAVANGGIEHPPYPVTEPPGPQPVRRKKHLGLYLGGAVAALATISEAARQAVRDHQGQVIGAVTGAAVTAATVTMVTVQPWTTESATAPPDAPPASTSPTAPPPGLVPPWTAPDTGPPARPSPSPSESRTSSSPSATPSTSASPSPSWSLPGLLIPIGAQSPPGLPTATEGGQLPGGDGEGTPPSSPGPGPSHPPPAESSPPPEPPPPTSSAGPPAGEAGADALLCLGVALQPLLDANACLLS